MGCKPWKAPQRSGVKVDPINLDNVTDRVTSVYEHGHIVLGREVVDQSVPEALESSGLS